MPKILEILTQANVDIDASQLRSGGNTSVTGLIAPSSWRPWIGFDYRTLSAIFTEELKKDYRFSAKPTPLVEDLRIFTEETLEDILRRFEAPLVNYCLFDQTGSPHFGRGSRCESVDYKPDWSTVSHSHLQASKRFENLLPGDTKVSRKWRPEMKNEGGGAEWRKVMTQIMTYMAYYRSRYGFIITDRCLVPLRITRKPSGPGIARTRTPRSTAVPVRYPNEPSTGKDDPAYEDKHPLQWEYELPEYVVIPWSAKGPGQLTVKLALWFLGMMVTNGDRHIDYSYPDLNSWRFESGSYIHNTSGVKKPKLSIGDKSEDRDPEKKARAERQALDTQQQQQQQQQHPQLPLRQKAPDAQPTRETAGGNGGPTGGHDLRPRVRDAGSSASGQAGRGGGEPVGGKQPERRGPDPGASGRRAERGRADPVGGGGSGERPAGNSQKKVKSVKIEKHTLNSRRYFMDDKGEKVETAEKEWTRVEGGWKLEGKRCIYFTSKFP